MFKFEQLKEDVLALPPVKFNELVMHYAISTDTQVELIRLVNLLLADNVRKLEAHYTREYRTNNIKLIKRLQHAEPFDEPELFAHLPILYQWYFGKNECELQPPIAKDKLYYFIKQINNADEGYFETFDDEGLFFKLKNWLNNLMEFYDTTKIVFRNKSQKPNKHKSCSYKNI